MITVYKVKYISPTDTAGARFLVTRMDDHRQGRTPYNHGVNNAVTNAIHAIFGEDPDKLEFVGCSDKSKNESFYAINR
jgi:hypothetical protein